MTFAELKRTILRLLDEAVLEGESAVGPVESKGYSANVLKDSVRAALRAVADRYWKRGVMSVAADALVVELPSDLINIDGVYEIKLGIFFPKLTFQVGNALASSSGNGWYLYPSGSMTFINKIGASGATIFYQAHWTPPEEDADEMETPDFLETCLAYYAGAYLLTTNSVSSAAIRQFNSKVDSGQPGDIPQMKMSDFLMRRYEEELKKLPLMEKVRVQ